MTELAEYAPRAERLRKSRYVRNNERQFDAQAGELGRRNTFTALWMMDLFKPVGIRQRADRAGGVPGAALVSWGKESGTPPTML